MDSKASRSKSQARLEKSDHDQGSGGNGRHGSSALGLQAMHELLDLETKAVALALMKETGKMLLRERTVDLLLKIFLTLTVAGLEIALFIVSPILFPFSLMLISAAAWRVTGGRGMPKSEGREEDP
jgi:hypothetical protein